MTARFSIEASFVEDPEALVNALTSSRRLFQTYRRLPLQSRRRIASVLQNGGWMSQTEYVELFPEDLPFEEWDWGTCPDSPLGRLRFHALLFLGQAKVLGTITPIVVVPSELREPLSVLLWDEPPYRGEGRFIQTRPGRPSPGLKRQTSESPSGPSRHEPHRERPLALPLRTERPQGEDEIDRLIRQGNEALGQERLAFAEQIFEKARVLDPLRAEPHLHCGHLALRQSRLGRARRFFEKAAKLATRHVSEAEISSEAPIVVRAYHGLVSVCVEEGRYDEAAIHLRRILELDPKDRLKAGFLLPEVLLRVGDFEGAEQAFSAAKPKEQRDEQPEIWFGLGLSLAARGRLREAALVWRRALLLNDFVINALAGHAVMRDPLVRPSSPCSPETARAYIERTRDLWESQPECLRFLRALSHCGPVAWERRSMNELRARILRERDASLRVAYIERRQRALDIEGLRTNHDTVLRALGLNPRGDSA